MGRATAYICLYLPQIRLDAGSIKVCYPSQHLAPNLLGALLTLHSPEELLWREGFVPKFIGNHVKANMTMSKS